MKPDWSVPRITALLEPVLAGLGLEIYQLEIKGSDPGTVVSLRIDREGGVSLGDCEAASRAVSGLLESADPFRGRYTLEVSSPGIDRKLVTALDFQRQLGRRIQVRFSQPGSEVAISGTLLEVGEEHITLDQRGGEAMKVELPDIIEARPVIEI